MESPISSRQDPYLTLGVDRNAGDAAIKRAYFRKVREHPPEQDSEMFQEIRAAYERVRRAEDRARTEDPSMICILDQDIDLARHVLATIDGILGPEDPYG